MSKRLIVVDLSSFIFRAFYAIRTLHSPEGVPINAVHGVLSMMLKLISQNQPTHVLLARDTSGGSFRNEMYEEYKANRGAPPEDLIPQFALIKQLTEHMGLVHSEHDNFEADDIIGAACVQWKDEFDEIYIASSDKDLMQFVGDNIYMLDTMKEKLFDADGVFEKMGVRPDQIVDYLAMVGDASDNVPGMKGIGAKGAAKLLAEHGTLEKCIEVKDTFKGKKLTNAFENHVEDALISKKLVQIVTDVDLGKTPEDTKFSFYPTDELINYLKGLGFKSAIKKLEDMRFNHSQAEGQGPVDEGVTNLSEEKHKVQIHVETVDNSEKYKEVCNLISKNTNFAMHTEYDQEDLCKREIVALSFSFDGEKSYYLPFFGDNSLDQEKAKELIELSWENDKNTIITEHSKRDFSHAIREGVSFSAETFDTTQAHYVAKTSGKHTLEFMAEEYLAHSLPEADKKNPFIMEREDAAAYCGERAACLYLIGQSLDKELEGKELKEIYSGIDNKLNRVLSKMEFEGIILNKGYLEELEEEFTKLIDSIQAEVDKLTETPININSPKQVGVLLFEELDLPVIKKTKTGYSTDSEVLEKLDAMELSEIPGLILKYREVGKILSTYVKALPQLINEKTNRIHTNFNQHVAQTGRLSSVNPNLQNIPIRSENGRRVRKGFIAKPGHLLLSADYSQVELRLLAHFSGDETMKSAFNNGEDIHAQTAAEVMGLDIKKVSSNERRIAKAVNFGLMYGQSSFGLANAIGISRKEAKEYITNYFLRFSSVKSYLDTLREECEDKGYSITMDGRKRFLPEINSTNRTIKANAERMAINSPIQGTAADIIKKAMINIDKTLESKSLKSKMLLQVHDELIFEVPEDELEEMKKIVKEGMENVVSLSVPLSVDMGLGANWFDLK
jgi:DNA polymerase-1